MSQYLIQLRLDSSVADLATLFDPDRPTDVALTNINYSNDPKMLALLETKRQIYPNASFLRTDPLDLTALEQWGDRPDAIMVLDNFNLLVSNILLTLNTPLLPELATIGFYEEHIQPQIHYLAYLLNKLPIERDVYLLSASMSGAWHTPTSSGRAYIHLLNEAHHDLLQAATQLHSTDQLYGWYTP